MQQILEEFKTMTDAKEQILEFLKQETGLEKIELEIPPNPVMGDYAFPCFALAKMFKKSPAQIASELSAKFTATSHVSRTQPQGPYLNFFVNTGDMLQKTLGEISKKGDRYGSSEKGNGKKICIEHTSINPNASPHVGRARNALIGDALVRLLRFTGHDVKVHYFVNDIGKQIALLVIGAQGKKRVTFDGLLALYIDINARLQNNPEIEPQAFTLLNKFEHGDKKVQAQFKKIVDICITGQSKIFAKLGIRYDFFDYESEFLFTGKTDAAITLLEKTGKLFIDGNNRWVFDLAGYGLGMKVPVFVMTRGDGTSLYGLRDIAYNLQKIQCGDNIIVLGEDQKLYFEQISAVLKELKLKPPRVVHYSFVLLSDGKMSTRKGNVVLLSDFMKEAAAKAEAEIKKRHTAVRKKTAEAIGYGALKYTILRVSPEKSVVFNLESALSFEGETAPYIQYAAARITSILAKHKKKSNGKQQPPVDFSKLAEPSERELVKCMAQFPDTVAKATDELRPHLLCSYVYELAKKFNEYYHQHQILTDDAPLRAARIELVTAVAQVIKNALGLLGIDVVTKM